VRCLSPSIKIDGSGADMFVDIEGKGLMAKRERSKQNAEQLDTE